MARKNITLEDIAHLAEPVRTREDRDRYFKPVEIAEVKMEETYEDEGENHTIVTRQLIYVAGRVENFKSF